VGVLKLIADPTKLLFFDNKDFFQFLFYNQLIFPLYIKYWNLTSKIRKWRKNGIWERLIVSTMPKTYHKVCRDTNGHHYLSNFLKHFFDGGYFCNGFSSFRIRSRTDTGLYLRVNIWPFLKRTAKKWNGLAIFYVNENSTF